jgi:nucleotide-binding universal stress UspA family protein
MRVLIATDGSADALDAVHWARELPLAPDTSYLVISVVAPPVLPALPESEDSPRKLWLLGARAAVDDACAALGAGVRAEGRVVEGEARDAIVTTARTWGADLIVVGARGLSAVKEFLLGSVSAEVARHAPCPVLVCKGTPRPVRTITIAHDGSEGARAAMAAVTGWPLPSSTRLRVIGVAEPVRYPATAPGILAGRLHAAVASAEAERRNALERTLVTDAEGVRSGLPAVDIKVTVGPPARDVVEDAAVTDTDLLVVGARGLGAMKRLLLGSVSEAVLRHATCPVLVVHPRHQ